MSFHLLMVLASQVVQVDLSLHFCPAVHPIPDFLDLLWYQVYRLHLDLSHLDRLWLL
jgi:hypothetical protein